MVVLVGPFQLCIFYDSMIILYMIIIFDLRHTYKICLTIFFFAASLFKRKINSPPELIAVHHLFIFKRG